MARARAYPWLAAGLALALSGCALIDQSPAPPGTAPQARPDALTPPPPSAAREPSAESRELARYYERVEADLVGQGLMRTDGGGIDTPYTDTQLARNFEQIALAEEYRRGAGLQRSGGELGPVKKWRQPIRVAAEFGASVPEEARRANDAELGRYVTRLARVTGHPISMSESRTNFHVLFMSEDDRDQIAPRIKALVPDIDPASLSVFRSLPRAIHCLVIAFSDEPGGYAYGKAIAVIRAEHPGLLMKSCIHEEVAQGLGLANDSPSARPSIFNDDDEFALLTTHDEMLLKILYDPALTPGMSAETARPIIRRLATELTGDRIARAGPN
ncbi:MULTISPECIES: DUF2927 domain-containing protein [unclassified Roseivivax]|uniref:DUF2927 domain-containing protein n=1 Tax=Roseivivax sp. GX 12232 TaxID=2900547 RepID=UPI001E32CCAA|nr:DUF2927 domain-containing protein [Roseivivax sp. GX 12232]MCE0507081.1 DUF2927 domain-containing protein [Roseivivax sp. GX 12232]